MNGNKDKASTELQALACLMEDRTEIVSDWFSHAFAANAR